MGAGSRDLGADPIRLFHARWPDRVLTPYLAGGSYVDGMTKTRWIVLGTATTLVVVGFLLFRPDTLFTEVRADESLDEAFAAEAISTEETTPVAPPTSTPPATETEPTNVQDMPDPPTESEDPMQLGSGRFVGIDHTAGGTATIYEQDGRFVLRFEDDTEIQNGPDLYVWLLPSESYEGGTPPEFLDLGTLKGTVGGQNYELPSEFDPEGPWTVLIWCLRFAVPFASAQLA